jgi:hypothetical protein
MSFYSIYRYINIFVLNIIIIYIYNIMINIKLVIVLILILLFSSNNKENFGFIKAIGETVVDIAKGKNVVKSAKNRFGNAKIIPFVGPSVNTVGNATKDVVSGGNVIDAGNKVFQDTAAGKISEATRGLCKDLGDAAYPEVFSLEDLEPIQMHQHHTSKTGCFTSNDKKYDVICKHKWGKLCYPDNGEFQAGSTSGSCDACNHWNWKIAGGCECTGTGTTTSGKRPTVKRIDYKADPLQCCLAPGTKILGNFTCDPKYRDRDGEGCKPKMKEYCVGEKLNSDKCKDFCQQNEGACDVELKKFCADKNSFEKPENEKYDSICSCFYPQKVYDDYLDKVVAKFPKMVDKSKFSANPQCIHSKCESAMVKPNQKSDCPNNNIQVCLQNFNLKGDNMVMKDDASINIDAKAECEQIIEQNKNAVTNIVKSDAGAEKADGENEEADGEKKEEDDENEEDSNADGEKKEKEDDNDSDDDESSNMWLWIGILIFLCLCSCGALGLAWMMKKKSSSGLNQPMYHAPQMPQMPQMY